MIIEDTYIDAIIKSKAGLTASREDRGVDGCEGVCLTHSSIDKISTGCGWAKLTLTFQGSKICPV
jgi:hypothetical protein